MNLRTLASVGLACGVAVLARGDSNIQYQAYFRVQNGALDWSKNIGVVSIAQRGGPAYDGGVVSIGVATQALTIAGVANPGWSWFRNLSAGGTVALGIESGGSFLPFASVRTNEMVYFRLGTNAVVVRSLAGTNALEYAIFED
jgi:hypothetical protein